MKGHDDADDKNKMVTDADHVINDDVDEDDDDDDDEMMR